MDQVVVAEKLESLRRFKDDVAEVRSGTECGIGVKNYADVRVGDQIECFERIEVAGKILLVEIATQVIHDVLEDVILH